MGEGESSAGTQGKTMEGYNSTWTQLCFIPRWNPSLAKNHNGNNFGKLRKPVVVRLPLHAPEHRASRSSHSTKRRTGALAARECVCGGVEGRPGGEPRGRQREARGRPAGHPPGVRDQPRLAATAERSSLPEEAGSGRAQREKGEEGVGDEGARCSAMSSGGKTHSSRRGRTLEVSFGLTL